MLTDPAAAAWAATTNPEVNAPSSLAGRCGRCGDDGPTVPSSRIISERFTGFDAWPYGSRRLCQPCAWAYNRRPANQPAMLITATGTHEYPTPDPIADVLTAGALPHTHAVVLPTAAPIRRRHILPTAQWAHLATDGLVVPWDATAAARLRSARRLRGHLGVPWQQLSKPTPPAPWLRQQPPDTWPAVMAAWTDLHPWRRLPPLWAAARLLTARPANDGAAPTTTPPPLR